MPTTAHPGPGSPPTLLQQLQFAQQQQAQQRQADRHQASQLLSQAASAHFLHHSPYMQTAASSQQPQPPLSSSLSPLSSPPGPSSAQSFGHPFVAPISASSANVFRSTQGQGGADVKGFSQYTGYGHMMPPPQTSSSSLLSSAPSSYSPSPFSSAHPPASSLYHAAGAPSSLSSLSLKVEQAGSFSSGASTPSLSASSSLSSLLLSHGVPGTQSTLSSLSSLSALNSLPPLNPQHSAFSNLLLSSNPSVAAMQQPQPRMSFSDSLSALQFLSNQSSPFSSFPATPTSVTALASLSSSPRFTKAVALENDPFEGLSGMKGALVGRVKRACGNCKAAKTKCDSERPCRRCSRTGRSSSCSDSVHKKRGRKRTISGGNGAEEGDGGESGDEGDEDDGAGADSSTDSPSHLHPADHHIEKKAKSGQGDGEQLKLFLLDCALKFSHHLAKWKEALSQRQDDVQDLTNALHWFDLVSRADSLRKLLYTTKDGLHEDAPTRDVDLPVGSAELLAALEAAQKEIEANSDAPGYTLPLYPLPFFTSSAPFLESSPHAPHPEPPRAYFNDQFCQLLGASPAELLQVFSSLPSFLSHCSHAHVDSTISAFVDAVCSSRASLTLSGAKYTDVQGHAFDCIESVSVHAVRGVPIALAISLESLVRVDAGDRGARRLVEDQQLAKLADGDSEDEGDTTPTTGATTAGETTGGDSDASPIASAMATAKLMSPSDQPRKLVAIDAKAL